MAKRGPKLDAGDLLAIPLTETRFAISQIVLPGVSFYLGVDPTPRTGLDDLADFLPKMFAWTNDAEVWRGNWQKLDVRLQVAADYPRPNCKVGIDGQLMVKTFEGQILREFIPGRDDALNYRTSFSPSLVQHGVQAFNGDGPWIDSYDKMLPQHVKFKGKG